MSSHISIFILVSLTTFLSHQPIVETKHLGGTMPSTSTSLVLGLTHSRSFSPTLSTAFKTLEIVDMLEPLRELRDGYLISLTLGTPPQVLQVYLDTGSDLTWVPCGNLSFDCIECDNYKNYKPMSTFSPFNSTRDLCTSPFCTSVHSSDNSYDPCTVAGCSLGTLLRDTCLRPCPSFSYTYGAGGIVTGTLTRDSLRVHGSNNHSVVAREVSIPNFCFGCVGSTYREPVGIAGFGKGPLSFPSQLGFLQKGFSHCFLGFKFSNNPNVSSLLVIGDKAISSKEEMQFTPMLKSPMYPNLYYIALEAIGIGGRTLEVPLSLRGFDSQGNGGILIDSGTTYTQLPQPFYSAFLSSLESAIMYQRSIEHEAKTGFDLCYWLPCSNNTNSEGNLPSVSFHFLNNVTLFLPKESYFYAVGAPNNSFVAKCLMFQSMEEDGYGPAGVFGNFQQQNVEVVYDLEKERIGFQAKDCAAAAIHGLHGKQH